jgi:hypothetical protein
MRVWLPLFALLIALNASLLVLMETCCITLPIRDAPTFPCSGVGGKPAAEVDLTDTKQKIKIEYFSIDWMPPPATLAEFVAQSDAVAVIVVTRQHYRLSPCSLSGIETLATARVLTAIKDHPLLSRSHREIVILRMGGARRDATGITEERDESYPPFKTGGSYVVFLQRAPRGSRDANEWTPFFGEYGTVQISENNRLIPMSQAGPIAATSQMSLADLTRQIAAMSPLQR